MECEWKNNPIDTIQQQSKDTISPFWPPPSPHCSGTVAIVILEKALCQNCLPDWDMSRSRLGPGGAASYCVLCQRKTKMQHNRAGTVSVQRSVSIV